MHSPWYTLFGIHKPRTEVIGFVKEGYEPAREAFEHLLDQGMEENVQVRDLRSNVEKLLLTS